MANALARKKDIDAIVAGEHDDPFAVLGPHADKAGIVIRAFLPGARSVHAVPMHGEEAIAELSPLHPAGFFAARSPTRDYRLRIDWTGHPVVLHDPYRFAPVLGDVDIHLLAEGTHLETYNRLGAHPAVFDGVPGTTFAVWAPNASRVSVVGDFNQWDGRRHPMRLRHGCGVWDIFLPGVGPGDRYKYEIRSHDGAVLPLKADPHAFRAEVPPATASIVAPPPGHAWGDADWIASRARTSAREAPIAVYEVHLGSWRRREGDRALSYREHAEELVGYVRDMGFTHIELMPVMEHPFAGSWGYQTTGMFAPTSRFGTPDEFAAFVDAAHRSGIGVIADWVPGHFPNDAHGLAQFDGTHLYEHADPRQGVHRDWDTLIYNYGRREVTNFLLSSGLFWIDRFHIDGLRVDAVASMLYLDYSREAGEWVPNKFGGRENLEAIDFLKRLNEAAYGRFPGIMTVAEESTAWPMVSRPVHLGGLGFGYKWNMGWMHDTLDYIARDPIHRSYHHNQLTFGLLYAFTENFMLPLSHDEVVHGKRSLFGRMPGDRWQKFANLRLYFAFMYGQPGKKLLFMGGEFAQEAEWNHDRSLDWHLLADPMHAGMQALVRDLNRLYRATPALHARDCDPSGFEWIDCNDQENSIIALLRRGGERDPLAVSVCNFTPIVRESYRVGVPHGGLWREALNTDAALYGGGNIGNGGAVMAEAIPWHGRPYSVLLTVPPLAALILVAEHGG
ncbi:MAG: 1,4-alpha-glucan branching protein GlgB [Rhodospirillaceae bacterium]